MKTGALIVAAGMSSRMQEFKPMMQIGSLSMIQRIIATFRQAGAAPIVVITGHQAKSLEGHLSDQGVICLYNPDYEVTKMFASAKIGLEYLQGKCDRVLFTPADIPLFTVNTVKILMASDAKLIKPVFQGKGGHPLLINAALIPALLVFQGEGGMKAALKSCGEIMQYIEAEDEGILYDADTQEDYKKLLKKYKK